MKSKIAGAIFVITIIVGLVLVGAVLREQPKTVVTKTQRTDEIKPLAFRTSLGGLKNLTLRDLPSVEEYFAAASYDDRIYTATMHQVIAYDRTGAIKKVFNREAFACSNYIYDVAVIGDRLYVACWSAGVVEIDLATDEIVTWYDETKGLPNTNNLYLTPRGTDLWIATFGGPARLDTTTGLIKTYTTELGIPGTKIEARLHVHGNELWATVIAHASSVGGASRYMPESDTWEPYGPEYFKTKDRSRIDFDHFAVTDSGVFAAYQDEEPRAMRLAKYDPNTKSWDVIARFDYNDLKAVLERELPPLPTFHDFESKQTPQGADLLISDGTSWVEIPTHGKKFSSLLGPFDSVYYLLSADGGFFALAQADAWPRLLGRSSLPRAFYEYYHSFIRSPDGNLLVAIAVLEDEYLGVRHGYVITAFDLVSNVTIEKEFSADRREVPEPANFERAFGDVDTLSFTESDGKTYITQGAVKLFEIDPAAQRISILPPPNN